MSVYNLTMSDICVFVFIMLLSVIITAGYNDSLTCENQALSNVTESDLLRYGQCLTYIRDQQNRSSPCDEYLQIGVDRVFLPIGRAQDNLARLIDFAADVSVIRDIFQEPCRDAVLRAVCYFYFPPCGNNAHFEPPAALCEPTCRYVTEKLCGEEWMNIIGYIGDNLSKFILYKLGFLNCSNPGSELEAFPHCCSDAGIIGDVQFEPTTQVGNKDEGRSVLTIASVVTVTMIMVGIMLVVITIIAFLVIVKRYGRSKVVLQVTGDGIDIAGQSHFPSIIVHRDSSNNMFTSGSGFDLRYATPNDSIQQQIPFSDEGRPRVPSCYIRQMSESNLLIPAKQIKLLDSVGQGEFGVVYRGNLINWKETEPNKLVAVKTLKDTFSSKDISDLLEESLKMKSFQHINVLNLIGVCINAEEAPYLVMPYMLNGSLLSYLRKVRPKLTIAEGVAEDLITDAKKKLLSICLQIARGMEYLAEKKFVHRDLAARNCMIDDKFVIKVADFGLSEDVYCKDYFRQALTKSANEEGVIKLPVKWMALESLQDGIFTEKTDVWSFGVTCWEVFSLGRSPYPGVDPFTLIKHLEGGRRLDRPSNAACTRDVYDAILNCWREQPEKRPFFADLVKNFAALLEEVAEYMDFSFVSGAAIKHTNYDHLEGYYDHLKKTTNEDEDHVENDDSSGVP